MLYPHTLFLKDCSPVIDKFLFKEQQALFTQKMTTVVTEEYSEATLEVEVSRDVAEVRWMRQGVLIHPCAKYTLKQNGRRHTLTIHKVAISDRGTYSCETLHDRTQAQLSVERECFCAFSLYPVTVCLPQFLFTAVGYATRPGFFARANPNYLRGGNLSLLGRGARMYWDVMVTNR